MPPYVSRKRQSPSPEAPPPKRQATAAKKTPKGPKQSLFDAVDTPSTSTTTPQQTKEFLASLDDDDSSLSEVSSDDFEDVPVAKKRKIGPGDDQDEEEDPEEDEDGMDWEDAIQTVTTTGAADEEIGDLSISLQDDGSLAADKVIAASGEKKGPSKRERMIRIRSHCLHVQALLWHNAVRNSWLNDKELHTILIGGLSDGVKREIDRWREDMGMVKKFEDKTPKSRGKGKKAVKGESQQKRDGRDWGVDADRLETGAVNMSRGDPLLRLLKILTAYWRKKFTITAPGLRKQGYMPLRRLGDDIRAWKKDKTAEVHGERVKNVQELRTMAKSCEGSRDVGSQLFTALIRGLGLEARMVANLQPAGIGWSKNEEARPKKATKGAGEVKADPVDLDSDSEIQEQSSTKQLEETPKSRGKAKVSKSVTGTRKSGRPGEQAVDLAAGDSELSDIPSDIDDDASIVDVTPSTLKKKKNTKKYDRDLPFPIYWSEVLSPVSKTYIPVDPIILSTVASNQELLASFEPRGKRADQAKQVMCYTIAYAPDGSAKDVTIRYLKKHQLPGRTKGYRMPVEKIKVYNKRGKVKKYEDYDWFKTVMSNYERPHYKRTTADEMEEATELKPFKPAADKSKLEVESLQWYKQSAEFVLERHLRREEALLPGSEPVKTFTSGKGDKTTEEPVYRRSDVVPCKTAESWHKEGREIKIGEQPLKMVPIRAVTTIRKREIEDAERETGEKPKQGLFSFDQCDWIVPPPIKNGVIPRNAFGNMDVYTPSMVPKGAIHIPLRGTARICRKLEIDYAEACTGFEFGNRRAVPVLTGVVVAAENEDRVIDAWEIEEAEKKRKEDVKKEALVLHLWRKFLMGMRIVERMRTEYAGSAHKGEAANPFVNRDRRKQQENTSSTQGQSHDAIDLGSDSGSVAGGGFLLPGEEDDDEDTKPADVMDVDLDTAGGFMLDGTDDEKDSTVASATNGARVTPMSLQSAHSKIKKSSTDSEDDDEIEERSSGSKSTPKSSVKNNPRGKGTLQSRIKASQTKAVNWQTKKNVIVNQVDSSEELDELSSASSDKGQSTKKSSASKTTSPRVIITPRGRGGGSLKRGGKKSTPLKSRYFGRGDDEDDEDDDDGEDEQHGVEDTEDGMGEESEEVVKPRTTTARTRAKAN